MLKHVLLTGAMLVAAPAFAQTTPPEGRTPLPTDPATPPTPTPPAATPDTVTPPAAPPPAATADSVPAAPAAASAPVDAGAQIADVVNKEFPSYDKNSDGKLSKPEFGAWMFALRKASDPSLKDDAANKTYVAGAFKTADTDKSNSVSKDELTNYLVQGQKNAPPAAATPEPAPAPAAAPAPAPMPAPAPTPPAAPAPAPAPAPEPMPVPAPSGTQPDK